MENKSNLDFINYDNIVYSSAIYSYGFALGDNGLLYIISGNKFTLPSKKPCPIIDDEEGTLFDYDLSSQIIVFSSQGCLAYDNNIGRFINFYSKYGTEDNNQMVEGRVRDTIKNSKMFFMRELNTRGQLCSVLYNENYESWKIIPKHTIFFKKGTPVYDLNKNYLNKDSKMVLKTSLKMLYYSSKNKLYFIYLTDTQKEFNSNY